MGKIEEISNYESEAIQKSNAVMQSKHAERFQRMQERRQARGVSPDYNTFAVNEVEETSLSYVKNVKIIEAYFAEGKVEKEYEEQTTEVGHTAVSGDNLTKIANILGVTLEELRDQNNLTSDGVSIGQEFTVTKIEQTEKGENFILTKIKKAGIGNEVYIVVKTEKFNAKILEVNIKQGKEDGVTTKNESLKVLKEDEEVEKIEIITGEYSKKDYLNKDDFKDLAITKVTLRPKEDSELKEWNDKLEILQDKKTYLYLLVDAHTNNSDSEVTYSGTGENEDLLNEFLNEEGEYFELNKCTCNIENMSVDDFGFIIGMDYIKEQKENLEHGNLPEILAIVLHRTDNNDALTAMINEEGNGTHFYVAKDGTVYQAASLNKKTWHVGTGLYSRLKDETGEGPYENVWPHNDRSAAELLKSYPDRYPINSEAVGIEVVGKFTKTSGQETSGKYEGEDKGEWDPLTEEQRKAIICLCKVLKKQYSLENDDIFAHDDIKPKTKGEASSYISDILNGL